MKKINTIILVSLIFTCAAFTARSQNPANPDSVSGKAAASASTATTAAATTAADAKAKPAYVPVPTSYPTREAAFKNGERITFVIGYRAAMWPNTDVAEVVMNTHQEKLHGCDTYRVYANAKVMPFFKWFYDLDDTYQTWLDARTLLPVKFDNEIKENKYRYVSNYVYDWQTMKAYTFEHKLRHPSGKSKILDLKKGSFDGIALFYSLRSDDLTTYVEKQNRTLNFVLPDTIRKVNYKYLGKEKKKVKGMGTFNTLKFSCQLATSSGESFEDGSEFFLWISDDRNKIPLYIESPIRVGSITGRLTDYSGLKYPLSSKIK